MSIRGGTTKDMSRAYVEDVLAPRRREGDFVVSDNLAAHKDERVRSLIAAEGAKRIFLPPYSPHLYPIELAWAWVKGWPKLAQAQAGARPTQTGIGDGLDTALPLRRSMPVIRAMSIGFLVGLKGRAPIRLAARSPAPCAPPTGWSRSSRARTRR